VEANGIDITGGAPELHPSLPRFLKALTDGGHNVQVRTNLTVLLDPALRELMELYRNLKIRLAGSLPCPEGAFLPPDQSELEDTYKEILSREYGIHFNRLLTITNIPIGRFKQLLEKEQQFEQYQQILEDSFNPDILDKLMCRHQVCIGWDGQIYDCDFNFALKLPVSNTPQHISQFDCASHKTRKIVTGDHCYGCTAGYGSSCNGALQY
jgi:MoaA/NifB/PqqE/SkfB family radical SAM enzyme